MLAGLLVGSIDTVSSAVANIVVEMIKRPQLMQQMRQDRNDTERLRGWCWEALRLTTFAPLFRQAGDNASLLGKPVPKGTRVVVLRGGAMHDPAAFEHPKLLNPSRPPDRYLHFGRGIHQCSGRDFNAIQIPELIKALLQYDISGQPQIRTRGLVPDQLIIHLHPRQDSSWAQNS